jgi:hypothetical protein
MFLPPLVRRSALLALLHEAIEYMKSWTKSRSRASSMSTHRL